MFVQGGVLFVKPRQAHHVLHKRWYKGGLLGSTTTCKITCAGTTKLTVTGQGPDPIFTEPLEFLLGKYTLTISCCDQFCVSPCVHVMTQPKAVCGENDSTADAWLQPGAYEILRPEHA